MNSIFNFRIFPVLLFTLIITIIITSAFGLGFGLFAIALFSVISAFLVCIKRKVRFANNALIVILIATIATFTTYIIGDNLSQSYSAQNAEIIGNVSIDTAYNGNSEVVGQKFVLDNITCNGEKISGKATVIIQDKFLIKIGDRVILRGDITTNDFKYFDSNSARESRYDLRYVVENATINEVLVDNVGVVETIKLSIKSVLYRYAPHSAEVIYAMMFGDKANMTTFSKSLFSAVGLSHLFAVSGLHIGIIAGAITLILRKCRVKKSLANIITTIALILYGALCDFSPSVIRSIIMVVVFNLSSLFGARNDGISSLSLAGVLILLFNPIALFDLSFVMTMLAVYGILCFYKPIANALKKLPKWMGSSLAMAFAVNITLLPVMLCVFGVASYKFIIATILVVPLASLVFPFMLLSVIIAFIPYIGYALVPFEYLFIGVNYISLLVAKLPIPSIKISFDWWIIVVYIALITIASNYCMCKDKLKKGILGALVLSIMALSVIDVIKIIKNPSLVKTIYVNEYSQSEMIIADSKGYLIVRGGLNYSMLINGMKYLYDNNIYELEAIVMDDFKTYDLNVLKEISQTVKINQICSFYLPSPELADIVNGNVVDAIYNKNINICFNKTDNEIYVKTADVDILFLEDKDTFINSNNVIYELIFTDKEDTLPKYYADKVITKEDILNSKYNSSFELYNGKLKEKQIS